MSETPTTGGDPSGVDDRPIPEFVDWIVAGLLALVGLATAVGGVGILSDVDRSEIREAVAEEQPETDALTGPEIVDVLHSLATWTGVGLVVTGVLLIGAGVGYVLLRRQMAAGERTGTVAANAVLGAAVTAVLSFVPLSQIAGGFVAGYLEQEGSRRPVVTGALSGVLSLVAVLVPATFAVGGAVSGLYDVGEGGLATFVVGAFLVGAAIVLVIVAGLGALGGFLGKTAAED